MTEPHLVSVGPLHLETPALHRNQACKTCRSRKIRCDARKPVCTPCSKARRKRQGQVVTVECIYPPGAINSDLPTSVRSNTPPAIPPLGSKKATKDKAALEKENEQLRKKVQELEEQLSHQCLNSSFQQKGTSGSNGTPMSNENQNAHADIDPASFEEGLKHAISMGETFLGRPPVLPDTDPNGTFFTIIYPGYPATLPHPTILRSLVDVFFERYYRVCDILDQTSFLIRLNLPPTHVDYPNEALLHAVCALASLKVEPDDPLWKAVGVRVRYWGTFETPGDYHYNVSRSLGMAELGSVKWRQFGLHYKRRHIFQITQSLTLITSYAYMQSRFLAAYSLSGLSVRMCIALGLNHIDHTDPLEAVQGQRFNVGMKRMAMEPPVTEGELHERSVTFWWSAINDWFASAATGWSMAVRVDDITSILPLLRGGRRDDPELIKKSLDIHSPGFFTTNPPDVVGPSQLQVKACVLIAKVVEFIQHDGWGRERGMGHPMAEHEYFKTLDKEINEFRLSFPKSLNSPNHTSTPAPLYTAHALSHVSTLLLHAPYCSTDPDDLSMIRCLASARAIIAALLVVNSSVFRGTYINPFSCFALSMAGRTLIREYAVKKMMGDVFGATSSEVECKLLILNLNRMGEKVPMAISIAKILSQLLQDPSELTKGLFATEYENQKFTNPENGTEGVENDDTNMIKDIPRGHLAFFGVANDYAKKKPPNRKVNGALLQRQINTFHNFAFNHSPEFIIDNISTPPISSTLPEHPPIQSQNLLYSTTDTCAPQVPDPTFRFAPTSAPLSSSLFQSSHFNLSFPTTQPEVESSNQFCISEGDEKLWEMLAADFSAEMPP